MRLPILILVIMITVTGIAYGADSPQFRGSDRTGKFNEPGLMKQWPATGPAVVWVAKGLGQSYGSVSVAKGKIYVPGMLEGQQGVIFVLNMDGKIEQKISYGKDVVHDNANGPRATPTIDDTRLYFIAGTGVIYCIDLATTKTVWEVNLIERFKGKMNTWFFSESPLVDGDRVICTPGGPDAGMVAFNKMTGETVWKTAGLSDQASYCSPIIVNHKGHRIILNETAKLVVGVDATTGKLLWTHPHETDYDIHAVTPVYKDGLVYYSGGYGSGGGCLELSVDGSAITQKWTDKTLDCQHHGVVEVDGFLYGASHAKGGQLICLDMATGKVMWSEKSVRQGVVIYNDGMLYVYEGPKSGIVDLVKASPKGFERAGTFTVKEGTENHWAHPTLANGRLYIRHGDALIAYDIKAK